MRNEILDQVAMMGVECALVAVLLLAFFRFRRTLGFAPLHATLGVFYQLATLMAGAFYIQIDTSLMMSPAAIVLFPATVFAILFVYIREDAGEARRMIYGLLGANLVVGALGLLVSYHLQGAVVFNAHGIPSELITNQPSLLAIGAVALIADVGLVIYLYDLLGRHLSRWPFVRIYATTAIVLVIDTSIFVTGGFSSSPDYASLLQSGILGKLAVALVYSLALTVYLRYFDIRDESAPHENVTRIRTYRERFEELQQQSMRDPLTGLFHRGMFDTLLGAQVARSMRSGDAVSLMMLDIDRFKQVNDLFGHREGDEVLRAVARTLQTSIRASDFACRFGGEEFALLLPDTSVEDAVGLAERIRSAVTSECRLRTMAGTVQPITISIGIASAPREAMTADALIELADRRLYDAKRSGRDRTTATGAFAPLPHRLRVA